MKRALVHEELTKNIIQTCFDISHELGAGFLESVYEKALLFALKQRGLKAQAQVINYLQATGVEVGLLVNFGKPKIEIRRLHKPVKDQPKENPVYP